MTPGSCQSETIGTGERRMRPTVVLTEVGHVSIGPRAVLLQSNADMISASMPPPAKNARVPEPSIMGGSRRALGLISGYKGPWSSVVRSSHAPALPKKRHKPGIVRAQHRQKGRVRPRYRQGSVRG